VSGPTRDGHRGSDDVVDRRASCAFGVIALTGFLVACGPGGSTTTSERRCGAVILRDWANDGRLDARYSPSCYLAAIDDLPEDVRAYSSAEQDIRRALQSSVRRQAG
jgi:hypothetical protein